MIEKLWLYPPLAIARVGTSLTRMALRKALSYVE